MAFRQIKSPALADQAVITAKLDTTAVSGQTAATALIGADELLIHDSANGALKKITSANLIGSYTTDDVAEGTTNVFHTDVRVQVSVDNYLTGGTGVTYGSGGISIGQDVAPTANVQFNNVTVDGTLSTDDITAATVTAVAESTSTTATIPTTAVVRQPDGLERNFVARERFGPKTCKGFQANKEVFG